MIRRFIPMLMIPFFMALFVWLPAGIAEIYKYQDESGNWVFTDTAGLCSR